MVIATLSGLTGQAFAQVEQLQWLEAPTTPQALTWAKEQTESTKKTFSAKAEFQPIMNELRTALKANAPLADVILLGPRALRLQKDLAHPHGQLQVADRAADGSIGDWRTVLDVGEFGKNEGKSYELHLTSLAPLSNACLGPDFRYCLLRLSPSGGDEVELREFDFVHGKFVEGGFQVPASRTDAVWLDKDHVVIAHTLGDSPRTGAGWGAAVRLWQRGTPVMTAPVIYQASPTDALVLLGRIGQGNKTRAVIERAIDYSTFEFFLYDGVDKPAPLNLPKKLKPFGMLAQTERHLIVQMAEPAPIGDTAYPAETLLSYDTDPATSPARKVGIVYQPADGELIDAGIGEGVVGIHNAVVFNLKRGADAKVVAAVPEHGGWRLRDIASTPVGITVSFDSAEATGTDIVVRSQGYLTPPKINLLRSLTMAGELGAEPAAFDASRMLVERREARSLDGTMVDYYLIRPRNIAADKTTPTLMTGYGAFGVTLHPGYLDSTVGGKGTKLWFERGGALVIPAIRGGGDRGAEWHRAAIRENRQRSYEDFIAVAEDLVRSQFVKPSQLGVFGTSNGGLLAATIGLQRPDLFGAVVSDVPLIDMLRFPQMGMGGAWINEYGDPSDPAMAKVLRTYSPLHIAKPGVAYPPFMVTVATSDNRVGPGHARKMVARLQELDSPAYLYEDSEGGHGVSDSLSRPDLMGLRLAFLVSTLMNQQ